MTPSPTRYGCSARTCGSGSRPRPNAKPDGEVSADAAREAGGHLNYAATAADTAVPPGSFTVIISPQHDVHRAAMAVAGDQVYLAPPEVISDIAGRPAGAWDTIRDQTRTLGRRRPGR
jgi:hypothetical protein